MTSTKSLATYETQEPLIHPAEHVATSHEGPVQRATPAASALHLRNKRSQNRH